MQPITPPPGGCMSVLINGPSLDLVGEKEGEGGGAELSERGSLPSNLL